MKSFSSQISAFDDRACVRRSGGRARARAGVLVLAMVGLQAGGMQTAEAQPGEGAFVVDGRVEAGPPVEPRGYRDWRNTLGGQDHFREAGVQRRKMSEEERSVLREHLRDAARGAYPESAPKRKGKR